jgi:hypothetical protein
MERHLVTALRRHLAGSKPDVPEAGVLLWNLFMEISAGRTWHMAGPNPISFAEIEAFARLHRWPLQPHHVAIIRALDDAWLEHAYSRTDRKKDEKGFNSRRYANAQPMTAEVFDLVFG